MAWDSSGGSNLQATMRLGGICEMNQSERKRQRSHMCEGLEAKGNMTFRGLVSHSVGKWCRGQCWE